jgi:hypothetical protein
MKKYLIEKLKALRQLFVSGSLHYSKGDIPLPEYYVEMKNIKIVCYDCMREMKDCGCVVACNNR